MPTVSTFIDLHVGLLGSVVCSYLDRPALDHVVHKVVAVVLRAHDELVSVCGESCTADREPLKLDRL